MNDPYMLYLDEPGNAARTPSRLDKAAASCPDALEESPEAPNRKVGPKMLLVWLLFGAPLRLQIPVRRRPLAQNRQDAARVSRDFHEVQNRVCPAAASACMCAHVRRFRLACGGVCGLSHNSTSQGRWIRGDGRKEEGTTYVPTRSAKTQ